MPGAQGPILAVLVEKTAELISATIARLSGVSVARVSRVLPALVDLGILEGRAAVNPDALRQLVTKCST